jgi:rubrerythrin
MIVNERLLALLRDALEHEEIGRQSYQMAIEDVHQPEVRAELALLARDSAARAARLRRLLGRTMRDSRS